MHARASSQRGSVLATSAVVLAGLIGVAGLSVLSVQRGLGVSGQQRGHAQALHAAEAGVAAAAVFLKDNLSATVQWGPYVVASCSAALNGCPGNNAISPPEIVGNGAIPGAPENVFDADAQAWYDVTLFNNPTDPGFALGTDDDSIIVIRAIGRGPDGARVVIEVEVAGTAPAVEGTQCTGYAQQGLSELNSGRNDCFLGGAATFDSSNTATWTAP